MCPVWIFSAIIVYIASSANLRSALIEFSMQPGAKMASPFDRRRSQTLTFFAQYRGNRDCLDSNSNLRFNAKSLEIKGIN
jgi:hypothetical protein